MKLSVDDYRKAPDNHWTVAKNSTEAIIILDSLPVEELSLDHDLGGKKTGYDIICWIEKQMETNNFIPPQKIICHSSNPVDEQNIELALNLCYHKGSRFSLQRDS